MQTAREIPRKIGADIVGTLSVPVFIAGPQPEVSFIINLRVRFRNKNTWSDDSKRYVWRFEATRIIKICLN